MLNEFEPRFAESTISMARPSSFHIIEQLKREKDAVLEELDQLQDEYDVFYRQYEEAKNKETISEGIWLLRGEVQQN